VDKQIYSPLEHFQISLKKINRLKPLPAALLRILSTLIAANGDSAALKKPYPERITSYWQEFCFVEIPENRAFQDIHHRFITQFPL